MRCKLHDDRTNEARTLENLGKNLGWFAEDNKQKGEERKLSEKEREIAKEIAPIVRDILIRKERIRLQNAEG